MRASRQRKKNIEPACCPVCSITLRVSEMANHFTLELDRLNKLSSVGGRSGARRSVCASTASTNGTKELPSTSTDAKSADTDGTSCWKTYLNIRNNRKARMKIPRKRRADDPECPICNDRIPYDIDSHVEACLKGAENKNRRTSSGGDMDDDHIDIEGDVYEWAGQTRIRATSLLEQGYAGIHTHSGSNHSQTDAAKQSQDEDDELNVDGDDTQVYGPTQYSECDVIVSLSGDNLKEESENMYLRNLIIGQQQQSAQQQRRTSDTEEPPPAAEPLIEAECTDRDQTIESLKAKIREYETRINKNDSLKCLICMDEFRLPVVSICCWHVHCEVCWLRTLGARKLCPQCNMITSPSDLRRVYM